MSFKKTSIFLVLACCAFLFNSLNIPTLVNKPKVELPDNSGSIPQNNDWATINLSKSTPTELQSEKEIPHTCALIETEQGLSITQSSYSENMALDAVPSDEEENSKIHPLITRKDRSDNSYMIEKGDTPNSIAVEHGISLRELLLANKNINSRNLQVGQTLSIPGKGVTTEIKIKANLAKRFLIDESKPTAIERSQDTKDNRSFAEQTSDDNKWDSISLQPLENEISSSFGRRNDPINDRLKFHQGIDIARPTGTKVFAWDDGVVTRTGWLRGYGLTIDVAHSNGIKTRYAHLKQVNVRKGQSLNDGQIIGQVGKTGRTTGANLHFEVLLAGKPIDPLKYLSGDIEIVEDVRENG